MPAIMLESVTSSNNPTGPTLSERWVNTCAATLCTSEQLNIIHKQSANQRAATAPLWWKKIRGIKRLSLFCADILGEPADFVYSNPSDLVALSKDLLRLRSPLELARLPAASATVSTVRQAAKKKAFVLTRPAVSYPYISLDESWKVPEQKLNSGRRSDLRRAFRNAEKTGPVNFEVLSPNLQDLPALMQEAFEIEARSWKEVSGTALKVDARRARFFEEFSRQACIDGMLRLCFLKIGTEKVAMQIAVVQEEGFWVLKIGYDAQYSKCSPGTLLTARSIQYAAEQGLKTYEFLGSSESWTRIWTQTERPFLHLRVYPLGIRGLAALLVDSAAALLGRLKRIVWAR